MSLPDFPIAESHFDRDAEGWERNADGDGIFSYNATAGNPGGCLQMADQQTGRTSYFKAPEKFLGRKATATRIEYEIKRTRGTVFDKAEIRLTRGDRVLHFNSTSPPRDGVWVKRNVAFDPDTPGWTDVSAQPPAPATQRDFDFVLSSLDDLQIRAEFVSGGETVFLDNVVMYYRKEPPTVPTL